MSLQTFLAGLAVNAKRVKGAYDLYVQRGDESSALNLIKETSQFLGTAAAGSLFESALVGKVIQKTGLDRIFDSFYNNDPSNVIPQTSMQQYLKNQKALQKIAGVGFNLSLNKLIDAINDWSPGSHLYDLIQDDMANIFNNAKTWTPPPAETP